MTTLAALRARLPDIGTFVETDAGKKLFHDWVKEFDALDWQPIETAPKDGTEVLLTGFYRNGDTAEITQSRWRAVGRWFGGIPTGWLIANSDVWRHVTHWQPLPAPPESKP